MITRSRLSRASGVQLHPTSLPGGRLGPEAFAWIDWLADAGQSWWQMLPLSPPDRHGSPYTSASAFAAWPGLLADPRAPVSKAEELDFREKTSAWIDDWAAYAGDGAVADQVRFDREWAALRSHAQERGVQLIGDVPIYVAPDSADHRAHPELFRDDAVAGVPPDAFTADGQLWGNPLYDWPALQRRGYRWWVERLRRVVMLFDMARVDHFRAFAAYWAVPLGAEVASAGAWKRGPGAAPFRAARRELGDDLRLIAEDLGVITEPVHRLRESLGFPGMSVLQFGYTPGDERSTHAVANHLEHQVTYLGTHDNDTAAGWYAAVDDGTRALVDAAVDRAGVREPEPHWSLIRLTFSSRAALAMIQLQDALGLGSAARMNTPGTATGAWKWRLDALPGPDLAARLRAATEAAGRL